MAANQGASKPAFRRPWEEETIPTQPAQAIDPQPTPTPGRDIGSQGGFLVGRGALGEMYPVSPHGPGLAMPGMDTAASAPAPLQRDVLGTLYDDNQISTATASPYQHAGASAAPPILKPAAAPVCTPAAVNHAIEHDHTVLMRELSMALRRLSPAQAAKLSAVQQSYTDHVEVLERGRLRATHLAKSPVSEVNEFFDWHRIKLLACTRDHMREYCAAAEASFGNRVVANKENTEARDSGKGAGKGKDKSSKNAKPKNVDKEEKESQNVADGSKAQGSPRQSPPKAQGSAQQNPSRESTFGYETEIDVGGPEDEYSGNVVCADDFKSPNAAVEQENPVCSDGFNACASQNDPEYAVTAGSAAHPSWMKTEDQSPDVSPASIKSAGQAITHPMGNQTPGKRNPSENGSVEEGNERSGTGTPNATIQRPKKGGKVVPFSRRTREVLETWYVHHFRRAYVHGEEADRLADEAGITVKQLRKWLSNRRNDDNNTRSGGYKHASAMGGGESRAEYGGPGVMPAPPLFPPPARPVHSFLPPPGGPVPPFLPPPAGPVPPFWPPPRGPVPPFLPAPGGSHFGPF